MKALPASSIPDEGKPPVTEKSTCHNWPLAWVPFYAMPGHQVVGWAKVCTWSWRERTLCPCWEPTWWVSKDGSRQELKLVKSRPKWVRLADWTAAKDAGVQFVEGKWGFYTRAPEIPGLALPEPAARPAPAAESGEPFEDVPF